MRQKIQAKWRDYKAFYKARPLLAWFRVLVVAAVVVLFAVKRNFWTPDTLFVVLLALFVVLGQARLFLIRFAPFILLLLAYDSFRGIADDLNKNVHFYEMINIDRAWFFGNLPTNVLQSWWWHGALNWYDFYFYFLYTIHFLMPVLLGVLIWKTHDKLYWPFVTALAGLSFAAFATYVIFPAAPPWMASDLGYIAPLHRISSDVWAAMGVTNFSEVYANLSPNAVAAVPSLHSAYPLLFAMFIVRLFSWGRVWWVMLYPVSMWVGVVYLGEHYVIDAVLGAAYALAAYYASLALFAWWRGPHFTHHYNRGYQWGYTKISAALGRG